MPEPRRLLAGAAVLVLAAAIVAAGVVGVGLIAWTVLTATSGAAPDAAVVVHHGGDDAGYRVWGRNDDGVPIRWDPCTTIELVVSPAGAPPRWRDDLEHATALLADASGLRLDIVGEVDERPDLERRPLLPDRYGRRWAPVLVAWASAGEGGLAMRASDRGVAVPIAVGTDGDRTYISGQVVLNASRTDLRAGFADRADSWGTTLLHELMHLLGLDHVDDPTQLMHTLPGSGPVRLGEGDLAGLAAVGAAHGCRAVPAPGDVPLTRPGTGRD